MRLEHVGVRYGRAAPVLDGVSLTITPGTVTAVLGDNGSGKSTLLRVAAGVVEPTTGRVRDRPSVVGYVPEQAPAKLRMPPLVYLEHMGRMRGLSRGRARARGRELLERLRLEGKPRAAMGKLSKGNAQKVILAQAVLVVPGLLVLDEPWAGLDADAHGVLVELIAECAQQGTAVLLTEHDPATVAAVATTAHLLRAGRLTEALTTPPARSVSAPQPVVDSAPPPPQGQTFHGHSPEDWQPYSGQQEPGQQYDQRQFHQPYAHPQAAPVSAAETTMDGSHTVPSPTSMAPIVVPPVAMPPPPPPVAPQTPGVVASVPRALTLVELLPPRRPDGVPDDPATGVLGLARGELPGVVGWEFDGARLRLAVPGEAVNTVIAAALGRGALVVRVAPAAVVAAGDGQPGPPAGPRRAGDAA